MDSINSKQNYVYELIDPRTNEIRYIGQTVNPELRVSQHKNDHSGRCYRLWLNELLSEGYEPIIKLIEVLVDEDGYMAETNHIIKRLKEGHRLVNGLDKLTISDNLVSRSLTLILEEKQDAILEQIKKDYNMSTNQVFAEALAYFARSRGYDWQLSMRDWLREKEINNL